MKNLWDTKYDQEKWVYGEQPNAFFKDQIDKLKPGRILLPAEGEGRNALYAAKRGWKVWAFDSSSVAQQKALRKAHEHELSIRYDHISVESFHPGEMGFDAIALIYTHFSPSLRKSFFAQVQTWLNPRGVLILEAFRKDQIHQQSGGPKQLNMLYSLDEISLDFGKLDTMLLRTDTINLNEGHGHQGFAEVVRYVGHNHTKTEFST